MRYLSKQGGVFGDIEVKVNKHLPDCGECLQTGETFAIVSACNTKVVYGCPRCHFTWGALLWPYGQAEYHEGCCLLHETEGHGYCDCKASDASDTEWGIGAFANPNLKA